MRISTRVLTAAATGAVAGNAAAFISTPAAAGYGKTFCSKGRIATGGASSSTCSCALSDDDRSNLPLSSDLFFSSRGRRWLTEFPTAAATATVVGGGHRRGLRALGLSKAETTDRSSQADAKYREALEDAQRMTKEHGVTSAQARAAWDVVDEIGASNNSIAWKPNLDEACDVIESDDIELCRQYDADLNRLEDMLKSQPEPELDPEDEVLTLAEIQMSPVPRLSSQFTPSLDPNFEITPDSQGGATRYTKLIGARDCVIYEHSRGPHQGRPTAKAFLRAGPRAKLHFKPTAVRAAVVTCGGLCPGLNSVIHHVVATLLNIYKAEKVLGIRGGFAGFSDKNLLPMDLTIKGVELLQHEPGSVLGSSRGGFDLDKIMDFIDEHQINHLYIIGGDGTHRGAVRIATECLARNLNVAVAGIPKTIDNDVDIIDRSFGFLTAVEAAQDAIISATTEARCTIPNGVGVVKLMGRSAGFIAAFATLASGDVDLCLIPESDIVLEGPRGCLPHVLNRVKEKGYAVVVVAEGAGEEILGETGETDATGHKIHPPVGPYMMERIKDYFSRHGEPCSVKYIDPSYMIRSVPANSYDQIYCMQLAQNAVHGAMAGYTAFSVGMVNDRIVYLPMQELVATSPRIVNPLGRTWENVLTVTRQPSTEGTRANLY